MVVAGSRRGLRSRLRVDWLVAPGAAVCAAAAPGFTCCAERRRKSRNSGPSGLIGGLEPDAVNPLLRPGLGFPHSCFHIPNVSPMSLIGRRNVMTSVPPSGPGVAAGLQPYNHAQAVAVVFRRAVLAPVGRSGAFRPPERRLGLFHMDSLLGSALSVCHAAAGRLARRAYGPYGRGCPSELNSASLRASASSASNRPSFI